MIGPKRHLGAGKKEKILFAEDGQRQEYLPEEIAQDIIARMLGSVEEQLRHKIEACVITHPSTFAPSQLYALKRAFTRCGVHIREMIHEPVAAALNYILDRQEPPPSYTLMVYDFGGGTTDITLIKVSDEVQPSGQRLVVPEILGVDGRRWFGGDDVTEAIARDLTRQFNASLASDYGTEALLQIEPRMIDALGDFEARERAWETRHEICRLADAAKIDISNGHGPALREIRPVFSVVYAGRIETVTPTAQFSESDLNALIKDNIDDTMKIMQGLLDKAGLTSLDIILLTGQSSRLPLVSEVISTKFAATGARIVRAGESEDSSSTRDELKSCVAKGACRIIRLLSAASTVEIDPTEMQPTATARIGIESTTHTGQPRFKEVIAAGEPVGQWKHITGVRIRRQSELRILENTSSGDDLYVSDLHGGEAQSGLRRNPEIEEIGRYNLSLALPADITDADLREAVLEMMLDARHEVTLRAVIGAQTYQFATERWLDATEEGG